MLNRTNTATEMASDAMARPAAIARGRSRQDVHAWVMNGRTTATKSAGCLMDAPTPTTTAPHHQVRHLAVTQIPSRARPIMRASLWAPPTKSMMRMGLARTNQLAAAGLMPNLPAMRGMHQPIIPTPISAGTLMITVDQ